MTSCTYDNPRTMRREHYRDGVMVFSVDHATLDSVEMVDMARFYGLGAGFICKAKWVDDQMRGDAEAMVLENEAD